MRSTRYLAAILCTAIALAPFIYTALFISQVDKAPEFTFYRIGDALSIANGEAKYVRPVQGIPTAAISKAVVSFIPDVTTSIGVRGAYTLLWSTVLLIPLLASIVYAWRKLTPQLAMTQAAVIAIPWWFGSAMIGLLIAHEYWQGEWAYLAITFVAAAAIKENGAPRHAHLLAGIWAGIGATLKITLAPVLLVLLLFINDWRPARILIAFVAAGIAYLAMLGIYMGDAAQTIALLKSQIIFFRRPNVSIQYAGFYDALFSNATVLVMLIVVAVLSLRSRLAYMIGAWSALHLFVIHSRPHGTSMTSFGIHLGLMLGLCVLMFPNRLRGPVLAAALAVIAVPSFMANFESARTLYGMSAPSGESNTTFFSSCGRVLWYLEGNHWNSTIPAQGFGLNGQLALRPTGTGAAYAALFPDTKLIDTKIPVLSATFKKALTTADVVYWTRPPRSDLAPLKSTLAGATITEEPGMYRGDQWIFGKAYLKGRPNC